MDYSAIFRLQHILMQIHYQLISEQPTGSCHILWPAVSTIHAHVTQTCQYTC